MLKLKNFLYLTVPCVPTLGLLGLLTFALTLLGKGKGADGYFYVKHSAETKTTYKQTLCSFSIEQRTMYPKTNQSYEHIFNLIAKFLWVKLRIRKHKNTTNNYYLIVMTSAKSKKKLRAYLDKYPLLSAKSFNYKDWWPFGADDLMND